MAVQDEIPKSRLTLRYKTEVNGRPQDITLPLRMMVTGDFSGGTSKDRKQDLDVRQTRNMDGRNTDSVMKDMGMSLDFSVANKIDPDKEEDMDVHIPIDGIKAFSPEQVAQHVPKVKGLLMVKELLQEVLSNVDNRKDFRKLLNELMNDQEALAKMTEGLKGFESFKVPTGKPAEAQGGQ